MTTTTTFTATFEEVQRAHRTLDAAGNVFYMVENSRGDVDEDGYVIEYKVQYHTDTHRFSCACPAGQEGFAHCHNKTGYCQHVRIAVVAAREDKKELHAARVAEANDVEAMPEFQAEYAEYLQEQEDIKAGYEHFDSCVPMPA